MLLALILIFCAVFLLAYATMGTFVRDEAAYSAMRRRRSGFLLAITPALARINAWIQNLIGPNNAIERAIRKASPLPLPADRGVAARFRENLQLVFRPGEVR